MPGVAVPGWCPAEGPRPVAQSERAIPSRSVLTEIVSRKSLRGSFRQAVLNMTAGTLCRLPGRFGIARALGPSYSLRCVVFHDISVSESPFTKGMDVSITPAKLETVLTFLASHYVPVSLQDVLDDAGGRGLPSRSILLTFDDGYASVMDTAVPLCRKLGLPAIFFVNGAFVDNQRLAPDNLVCYVANVLGMETINAAARAIRGLDTPRLHSQTDVYTHFFPSLSLSEKGSFSRGLNSVGRDQRARSGRGSWPVPNPKAALRLGVLGFRDREPHLHSCALQVLDVREFRPRNRQEQGRIRGLFGEEGAVIQPALRFLGRSYQ